jgi:hypothetical protein
VTSYSQPPAKEHSSPTVLAVITISFPISMFVSAKCYSPSFTKDRMAPTSDVTSGTPKVNVAVTCVAESTVTESAWIPAN